MSCVSAHCPPAPTPVGLKVKMWIHRFIYCLVLVLSSLFFALYPHWFAWYFLMLSLLILPFDLIISLPGMLTRRVSLSAPYSMEQGEAGDLAILIQSARRFPSGYIKMRLSVRDNDRVSGQKLKCPGTNGSRTAAEIDSGHCRVVTYSIKRYWAISVLGLFSIPVPTACRAVVLILPRPVKPPGSVTLPQTVMLRPKPGVGFSEEHDLRAYREGDQMRAVHWKLSAKHDSLIVREPLFPPPHSRLLHATQWKNAGDRDLILGRLRWVSDYLLGMELQHYVKFGDNPRVEEVAAPGDIELCLFHALGGAYQGARMTSSVIGRFSWVFRIDAS